MLGLLPDVVLGIVDQVVQDGGRWPIPEFVDQVGPALILADAGEDQVGDGPGDVRRWLGGFLLARRVGFLLGYLR